MMFDIGQITNTQGINGEVRVFPLTNDPNRFKKLDWVYLSNQNSEELTKYQIEGVRLHNNYVIVKFTDIKTMNEAEMLKGKIIRIPREKAVKLPKDSYFIADLIGMKVYDIDNNYLGIIHDVLETGSNDVYVIKQQEAKDLLIPAIKDVVREVNIDDKKMIIKLIEGLLE